MELLANLSLGFDTAFTSAEFDVLLYWLCAGHLNWRIARTRSSGYDCDAACLQRMHCHRLLP
jgi:hypothetical protein